MIFGDWDVDVERDGKGQRLKIVARPYGLEQPVSEEELRAFAAFLLRAADAAKEETR